MSFHWGEFLVLASSLREKPHSPGPQEASLRTAISRAYYAAFCSARNFARDYEGLALTNTGQDHFRVISHFQSANDSKYQKIGAALDRLRMNRGKADYGDAVDALPSVALVSVHMAERLLNDLTSL